MPRCERRRTPAGWAATCSRSSRALCVVHVCVCRCVQGGGMRVEMCVCVYVCVFVGGVGCVSDDAIPTNLSPCTIVHSSKIPPTHNIPELDQRVLPLHQPEQDLCRRSTVVDGGGGGA